MKLYVRNFWPILGFVTLCILCSFAIGAGLRDNKRDLHAAGDWTEVTVLHFYENAIYSGVHIWWNPRTQSCLAANSEGGLVTLPYDACHKN